MKEAVAILGALFAVCMIGLALTLFRKGARDYDSTIIHRPYWPEDGL
jgi:preprotein translocase subunit SecG